jgi:hypothetical protein
MVGDHPAGYSISEGSTRAHDEQLHIIGNWGSRDMSDDTHDFGSDSDSGDGGDGGGGGDGGSGE